MYRKVFLPYLTLFSLVSVSCSNPGEAVDSINLNDTQEKAVHEIVDSVTIIPLKDNGKPFFPALEDLIVTESYFIGRDGFQNIFVFDRDGNIHADSRNMVGHGHGEYYILMGYTYNPFSNTIEVLTPLEMKIYDLDFNFIKSVSLGTKYPTTDSEKGFYDKIYDLEANMHALIRSNIGEHTRYVAFYDSAKEKVVGKYDYSDDIRTDLSMQIRCFYSASDTIYFYPPGVGEYVYSLDPNSLSFHRIKRLVDYATFNDGDKNEDYMLTSSELMPIRFLCTDNHYFFLTKEGNTLSDMSLIVRDKKGESAKIPLKKDDRLQMTVPMSSYGNALYGLADEYNICDIMSAMNRPCADSLTMYPNIVVGYSMEK